MVVRDDDLEPTPPRLCYLLDSRDSAIDRQNKPDTVVGETSQRLARDAVSLLEPARQVPADVGAELAHEQDGKGGRTDPVDVVVAVNADARAVRHRGADALDGLLHISEKRRIVTWKRRVEEVLRLLLFGVSAPHENGRGDLVHAEITCEPCHRTGIDGCNRPRARHAR